MAGSSGNISSVLLCNELPNPFTPMAFLPPNMAVQAKISEFLIAFALAILIWDQLHTLSDDYQLAFKKQFRWPTAVYFISRISTLVHFLGKVVELNTQIDDCKLMKLVLNICLVFSRASIALLMYIRVCAVYNMNRLVVLFFGFTFLGVVAGVAVPFGAVEGTYIGSTKYCTTTVKHDYIFLTPVLSFANDTLIFLAIMYKLGMTDIRRSPTSPISTAWKSTDHLLSFTRVFLQDSQIYYSIAVAFNLASLITFFVANHPPQSPFRYVVIYPDMAVMNIMACRVFRNVKLGRHSQVLIMPTQLNAGNLTLLDCVPGTGTREHLYHTGDMRTSAEVSRWKESVRLPIPESHGQVIEKPNTHLSGVEVTKVIELTPS